MGMDYHCLVLIGIEFDKTQWGEKKEGHRPAQPCRQLTCPLTVDPENAGNFCSKCGKDLQGVSWTYYAWSDSIPAILVPFSKEVELPEMHHEENWRIWPLEHVKPVEFGEDSGFYLGEFIGSYSRWDSENESFSPKEIHDMFERVEADLRSLGFEDFEVKLHFVPTWA